MAFTSWAVLTEVGSGDVSRLRRLAVRFAKPVLPGQDITTRIWPTDTSAGVTSYAYETAVSETAVVTDGLAEIAD
jgi:acyl dehydratase